jgi:hypothetical protein
VRCEGEGVSRDFRGVVKMQVTDEWIRDAVYERIRQMLNSAVADPCVRVVAISRLRSGMFQITLTDREPHKL